MYELMNVFPGTRCYPQNPTQKKPAWKKLLTCSHSVLRSTDTKGLRQ